MPTRPPIMIFCATPAPASLNLFLDTLRFLTHARRHLIGEFDRLKHRDATWFTSVIPVLEQKWNDLHHPFLSGVQPPKYAPFGTSHNAALCNMLSLSCTLHFYFHSCLAVCKVPAKLNSLSALYIINTLCKLRRLHLFSCAHVKNLCAQTMHAFATRRAFRFLFCCAPARLTHATRARLFATAGAHFPITHAHKENEKSTPNQPNI